jgi:hypothetical protein
LRRLRPATVNEDARAHVERLKSESESVLRLVRNRDEGQRMFEEIKPEKLAERTAAAAVARHHVREVRAVAAEARDAITQPRRNTLASFPAALDGFSADGMATAELLRLHVHDRLSRATAPQLLNTMREALQRGDLRGYFEAQAIEALADGAVASSENDLPALRTLRDFLEGLADLRVPSNLPNFDELDHEANKLDARAVLLGVTSSDPERDPHAAAAFEQQRAELVAAGELDDAADQAAHRARAAGE